MASTAEAGNVPGKHRYPWRLACQRGNSSARATLPESLPPEKRQVFHPATIARNYLMVLRHPRFLLLALALGLVFGGLAPYIGSSANFVIEILGLPETAFVWMFIPLACGAAAGCVLSFLVYRLSLRFAEPGA